MWEPTGTWRRAASSSCDVDALAGVAGGERAVQVDHHPARVLERDRLADPRVVARGRLGPGPLVPVGGEHRDGVDHPVSGHQQIEVGERPQQRVGIGGVGEDRALEDHRAEVLQRGRQPDELALELHRPDGLRVELPLQAAGHLGVDVDHPGRGAGGEEARQALGHDGVEVIVPSVAGRRGRTGQTRPGDGEQERIDLRHVARSASWARTSASANSRTCGSHGAERGARALGQAGGGLGQREPRGEAAPELGAAARQALHGPGGPTGAHEQVGPQPPSGARSQPEPVRRLEGRRPLHGRRH